MDDMYEIFDNKDVAHDDATQEEPRRRKPDFKVLSCIMMGLVLVVGVANLIVGIMVYNKYDELQIGSQFYFQNGTSASGTSSGVIIESATENNFVTTETTTVMHVEITTQAPTQASTARTASTAVSASAASTTSAAPEAKTVSLLININTATSEELTALNGIGPAKAQAIIDYRNENGYFTSVEELTDVSGIGEKTLAKIRDYITIG